jgi:two-component system, chemotaxis family, CheB/CheR fusion protein
MNLQPENEHVDALLDYLERNRGFDFRGYKRASLMRRIQNRLQMVGMTGFGDYLDYLEVHPEEFPQLFNTRLVAMGENAVKGCFA